MADVYVNALTTISTEPTSTDSIVCVNRNTNEGQIIDYNLLADVILSKISSKTFSSLTTTSKLLTGAINELDADVASLNSIKWQGRDSLSSSTTDTDLITLPSGAYLVSGGSNWIPSGGGSYGTLISLSSSSSGAGSYGVVIWVNTNGAMFIRHHAQGSWHSGWQKITSTAVS